MKIKISQIVLANKALGDLATTKMAGSLSYQIKKLRGLTAPITKNFEDTKNELIKSKYGVEQEDKSYRVTMETMPQFLEEINGLLEAEEEIVFTKFKASAFDDIEVAPEFFDLMEAFLED
jgi:phenylalanyl-tRNA synthetase alpha subunit